ncbi:MAG: SPFH domain-containing protein [Lachnospiraceae bacterium]|jgi:membrane protease subunit (stomatin/prohibitin family)|nr:SPFH domain-containing protein [Lachnospiraceae bacterium]
MGLITAAGASLSSILGDQWKEYFYCSEMDTNVLVRKGQKNNGKSGLLNRGGSDNVITNGSTIVVNEGQCMIIVDQGAIVDICAQPGAYTYDTSTEPSVFSGGLGEGIAKSFEQFKARFSYGGVTAHDQRIYYFNTKDIIGNKYGTANPVPFRVVDNNIGLDVDISIRCFGEYSYRLSDPILFYKNICGNVNSDYTKDRIENQLRTELLTALQPAFGKISDMGIRYSAVVNHTEDMAKALNEVLSDRWADKYGIVISAFGISSLKASEEDEKMIKDLQKTAVFQNAGMAGAMKVNAEAQAMMDAAKNPNGAAMGFFGMGMAQQAAGGGTDAASLFAMAEQQKAAKAAKMQPAGGWKCPKCGAEGNVGKFCGECGTPKPADGWKCPQCGHEGNNGKFCSECGSPKPAEDGKWKCPKCGHDGNSGKFCGECGSPRP